MNDIKASQDWTASNLIARIPARWRGARVMVVNACGETVAVRRFSLQDNRDGRMLIVLHDKELSP